jgi:hypothetical protein
MNKGYLKSLGLIAAIAASVSSPAMAEDGKIGVGVTGGTLGIGPEVSIAASDTVSIRANATFLSVSRGFDSSDIDYDGTAKLGSFGLMFDYHIGGGGFRISAGGRINNNRAEVTATPNGPVGINGKVYQPSAIGTISGRGEFKNLAPALTLGYAGKLNKGLKFGFEAGALLQGSARIKSFKASGGGVLAADLEAERLSLQDDVDDFKVYPIVQLSLGYRF